MIKITDRRSSSVMSPEQKARFQTEMTKALSRFANLAAISGWSDDSLTKLWNDYVLPGIHGVRIENELLDKKLSEPL